MIVLLELHGLSNGCWAGPSSFKRRIMDRETNQNYGKMAHCMISTVIGIYGSNLVLVSQNTLPKLDMSRPLEVAFRKKTKMGVGKIYH